MKYPEFKALNMFRQAEYLAGHGRLLAERREDSFRLRLFAVADFYAEQWCEYDNEHLLFIHLFRHPAGLRDYLPAIRLPRDL
ncbi:hypothetical protein [Hymenobacter psychrophilus]|uniref:Uncharacterized protein n=1 Tax=Hymenobacter psychrophilus TaxID=651662 RepID=A0A1H3J1N9_9BACT|nr:hypothetical protein [Hymenobacter psychrophilus]SDY33505.1 hypothetical protein SAMN04488069_107235 [Hymenobacter psychrophilus]